MKKTILYMAAAMSMGSALLASCGSNDELAAGNSDLGKYNVTAVGSLGTSTRVAFGDADKTGSITTSWEANEPLLVFMDGNAVTLNATTVNDKTATFTGQVTTAPTSSSSWKAVTGAHAKIDGTNIICDYVGQDGSLASAQQYDYMVATATGTTNPTFDFSAGTKLSYILRMVLPEDVTAVELNAPKWTVTSSADPSNAGPAATVKLSATDEIQTITLATVTTVTDNVRYFAVPAVKYSINGLRLTVFKGETLSAGKAAFVDLSSLGGKVGDIDFSTALAFVARPTTSVDLGTAEKWASFNIGATTAEGYGNFYAWGETTTKTSYTVVNSKWNSVIYSDLQSKGVIDADGNLISAYDVATLNWGKNWRMPRMAELGTLQKCTKEWATSNTVNGYKFTATNGNSIFLPAAGRRSGGDLLGAGSYGRCWSSTAYDDDGSAYGLYFDSGGCYWLDDGRYYGYSVRPVTE